jgi:hypothetical protein
LLEIKHRIERMAQKQKMELHLMKMQATLENEKRDRAAERKEMEQKLALENEKRDRTAEKKETEQKMELIKMQAALENEKRDRQLENAKRDHDAALEKKQTQHQIEQLIGQLEQQLAIQPRYTQPINPRSTQHVHRETEQRLLQQLLEMKLQQSELNQPVLPPVVHTPQTATPHRMAGPAARPSVRLQDATSGLNGSTVGMATANTLQSTSQLDAVTSVAALSFLLQGDTGSTAALPSAARPLAPERSKQDHQSVAAHSRKYLPSKTIQPQHQAAAAAPMKGGSVPLPGDARTHFFLSHCQATGGDQTNAIYLELRQMGFSCWYDQRAEDLTKDGMKHGIEGAAAFLLFLSEGILDRPFCEWLFILECAL